MSQDIENQQITSLKYTAITPHLHQNEQKKGFWHVGHRKQSKRVANLFHCSRLLVHNDVRRYNWAGITTYALWPARRQDRTVKLLSCNYASGSSRNL